MKNIYFDKEPIYAKIGVQKIEVDENNVEFIDGLAVVEAKVSCFSLNKTAVGYYPKTDVYFCYGVINEKYEVAFHDKSKNELEKYFLFCEENKRIERFGSQDFVIERREKQAEYSTFVHIRLVKGNAYKVLETKKDYRRTSFKNLAIIDNQFYFVASSKFYGPHFEILKEDTDHPGEFLVIDKLVVFDSNIAPYSIMDILSFRMNANFEVLSVINSVIDGKSLWYDSINYLEIREKRLQELKEKAMQFKSYTKSLSEPFIR